MSNTKIDGYVIIKSLRLNAQQSTQVKLVKKDKEFFVLKIFLLTENQER